MKMEFECLNILILNKFDIGISFNDLELVHLKSFEMNQQQIHRESSLNVGWMRCMLVYDDSLSPQTTSHWKISNTQHML